MPFHVLQLREEPEVVGAHPCIRHIVLNRGVLIGVLSNKIVGHAVGKYNQGDLVVSSRDVWAVSPDGSNLVQLTDTPELDEVWAQLAPDGVSLLTVARINPGPSRYDHSYFLTDLLTGSTQELLSTVDLKRDDPTFSQDGQQIVFCR